MTTLLLVQDTKKNERDREVYYKRDIVKQEEDMRVVD